MTPASGNCGLSAVAGLICRLPRPKRPQLNLRRFLTVFQEALHSLTDLISTGEGVIYMYTGPSARLFAAGRERQFKT